jgi:hypothetical protein
MKINESGLDRAIRIVIGLFLLSMLLWVEGSAKYWGLVGIIPLLTGLTGFCLLYKVFGISTRRSSKTASAQQ